MLRSVQAVLEALGARKLTLAVAEGDTGGLLLQVLTAVPGSSAVVRGGVVAYHDDLKREVLGVPLETLQRHGSVSAEVAEGMARGVRRLARGDLGLAATGIAGPGGATELKPVGLASVTAVSADRSLGRADHCPGDRHANRAACAEAAPQLGLDPPEVPFDQ